MSGSISVNAPTFASYEFFCLNLQLGFDSRLDELHIGNNNKD